MHRVNVLGVLAAIWGFGAFAPVPAGAADTEPKKIRSIEGITEYALPNGLKVLLFPDPSKPTVTVNLTLFVGSRHEGYGETGMAHLLEHLLFKGTPDHPNIPEALKNRGARFNGTTWLDRTNYYETLPATGDNLEFAIRLEADRLVNSNVSGADLKSEMTVVRNEFERGENDPESILMQRMVATAYEWHNYGKSTIGNRADIERVPIENLQDFYRRFYQTDNAMLVVAGKFEPKQALALISKYFGKIPAPERKLNATYTEEPPQDGEREVKLKRVGDVAVVGATYHVPSGGHPQFAAVEVLEGVLSDKPSGRLYKSLVEAKKASNVYGMTYSLHDPGVILFMAQVGQGQDADAVLKAMLATIDETATKGVDAASVERIKAKMLKQRELQAADSARVAVELSEWAAQGDWRLYCVYRDRVEKVTAKDVSQAAAEYLKASNRTVGLFLPTKSPVRSVVPPVGDLAKSIGNYKGREDVAQGEAFDVSPANIDAKTKYQTLPSGVKAAFLEKKTRGQSVKLRLKLRYGDVNSLQGMGKVAEFLPAIMTRGTEKLTYQQIQDELDKLRTQLVATGSAGEINFSLTSRRENIAAALALLKQVVRTPALPEKELEIIRRAQISELEKGLTEPDDLAQTAVRRHITPYPEGDPRHVPTIQAEIALVKAVTVADLQKLHGEFLGGTHGELAVVGDFDTAEVAPLVNSILADWQPKQPYTRIPKDVTFQVTGGNEQIVTPDKANAMYFGATVFPVRDDDPEYAALALGNFVLGGGTLSSRLGDRVRQKEGLSYGVGSGLQALSTDKRTAFYLYAICNPANIEKVKRAIAEELALLLNKGLKPDELKASQQAILQRDQVARTEDGTLAEILLANLAVGRTMKFQAELEKRISALKADDVLKALKHRIDPKKLFIVTAGDFKKVAAAGEKK